MRVRSLATILLSLAPVLPLAAQEEKKEDRDLTDAFALAAAWLDAEQDYKDLPGIAVAVVRDQEVAWNAAFGHADVEAGVPLTAETRFHVASISKTFAAVAVMTLVDQGRLRLDDTVEDVVPWFTPPEREHDNAPITIRDLLTHSSGLSREVVSPIWSDLTKTPTGREMQAELSTLPPLYESRTVFQYSNLAFLLLGEIVAEVSGMPYNEYLEEHVLDPLGLESTVASYPEADYGTVQAIRYAVPTRDRVYPRMGYTRSEDIASMGGLSSTVLDLAEYASWQFRLHEEDATQEILRPSTLRDMHRVHFTDRDWSTTWGLGFAVDKAPKGGTLVSHGGHLPGHVSFFIMHPESKTAYIVMVNSSGGDAEGYARGLMGLVDKIEGVPEDAEHRLDRDTVAEYVGRYEFVGGMGEFHVGAWEGRLALLFLPGDDPADSILVYEHVEGDTFRRVRDDGEYGERLHFERGPDGEIRGANYFSYELVRVGS